MRIPIIRKKLSVVISTQAHSFLSRFTPFRRLPADDFTMSLSIPTTRERRYEYPRLPVLSVSILHPSSHRIIQHFNWCLAAQKRQPQVTSHLHSPQQNQSTRLEKGGLRNKGNTMYIIYMYIVQYAIFFLLLFFFLGGGGRHFKPCTSPKSSESTKFL